MLLLLRAWSGLRGPVALSPEEIEEALRFTSLWCWSYPNCSVIIGLRPNIRFVPLVPLVFGDFGLVLLCRRLVIGSFFVGAGQLRRDIIVFELDGFDEFEIADSRVQGFQPWVIPFV